MKTTRKRTIRGVGGRWSLDEIAAKVELLRIQRKKEPKQIYGPLGWTSGMWTKRIAGDTAFSVEELGKVAELLEAPRCWPFASDAEARALDDALGDAPRPAEAAPPSTARPPSASSSAETTGRVQLQGSPPGATPKRAGRR